MPAGLPGRLPGASRGAGAETADGGPALLVGTPWIDAKKLYNAYCLDRGAIAAVGLKVNLPNYGVLMRPACSRRRRPVRSPSAADWADRETSGPSGATTRTGRTLAESGAELMIVPNGSPYARDKDDDRSTLRSPA